MNDESKSPTTTSPSNVTRTRGFGASGAFLGVVLLVAAVNTPALAQSDNFDSGTLGAAWTNYQLDPGLISYSFPDVGSGKGLRIKANPYAALGFPAAAAIAQANICTHIAQQVGKQLRGAPLVLHQRIALGIGFQANRDAQRFHLRQVLHPQLADHAQQQLTINLGQGAAAASRVNVSVQVQQRDTSPTELNVIGCTVDEAVSRADKFLDEAVLAELRSVRIIHGHGTGQLRRGLAEYLREHPLVSSFAIAPPEQGGGGATIVELKE